MHSLWLSIRGVRLAQPSRAVHEQFSRVTAQAASRREESGRAENNPAHTEEDDGDIPGGTAIRKERMGPLRSEVIHLLTVKMRKSRFSPLASRILILTFKRLSFLSLDSPAWGVSVNE